ncbi:MAG: hypothetical protein IT384_24715, partial [Deltaproteobacteria bacterium]|nr:hypothetical protein [Deltaproteobacteria bacterium]
MVAMVAAPVLALAELAESGEDFEAARFLIAKLFPSRLDFTQVSAWDLVAEVEIRVAILEETTTRKAFDQVAGTQLRRS